MVNRIWQHHFGRGIVATPSNFGLRGEPPTHPELLDWLAGRFVARGWSVKAMHREIVLSQTYQLSSELDARDAARRSRRSLALAVPAAAARRRVDPRRHAGRRRASSTQARPGPHPFPPIETWHWTQHDAFKAVYPSSHRSVYLMTQRLVKHPLPGDLRRAGHQRVDRRPPAIDRPAPGALPHEQPVRPANRPPGSPAA